MDVHEKRQLELASQVARVRARTRPWRSIIAFVLAIAAGATAAAFREGFRWWTAPGGLTFKVVTAATAAGFCLFASVATIGLSGKAREMLRPVTGSAHAAIVRYSMLLIGGVATLVITLDLLKIPIGQLVVGGALTTILIGIAAQQSLSNVFAGMMLLLSRPFTVGDLVQLRSGSLGGLIEGTVTEVGITYTHMDTRDGVLRLPNSQVLAAGVGPVRRASAPGPDGDSPSP